MEGGGRVMTDVTISKDKVWSDVIHLIRSKGEISTTRGEATARLNRIEGETIYLESIYRGKTRIANIKKADFNQAIEVLLVKGKVRQTDLSNKDKRYVLGAMKELPYFKKIEETTPDKTKPVPFIVWR